MGFILGRLALDGRAVDERGFRRAFDGLRPKRCVRSDMLVDGSAGYGHHDTGLCGGLQAPQPVRVGALTILADARLDDREDLARALNVAVAGQSDAGLIGQAYRRWGAECLARIHGDFGIAIHDRERGEIFLARDHIGARPLFWTTRGPEVLFATLLSGLTGFDDLDWPLDEARVARHVCDPHDFRLESFLAGVEAVGPGHFVRITATGVTRQRWWDPVGLPEQRGISVAEAQEKLRFLTEQAVRVRLPAGAAVGAHFSGGIDSTLITILAARQLQARGSNLAAAYAWCPPLGEAYPDMGESDERRVIAAQCRALGVPSRHGAASDQAFEALAAMPMEKQGTADLMDEVPIIDQAHADGIGVMLSGWGGDEAFSSHGFGHLAWLLRRGKLRTVLGVARRYGGGLRRPHRIAEFTWRSAIVPLLPDMLYSYFDPFSYPYSAGAFPSEPMRRRHRALDPPPSIRITADAGAFMNTLLLNGHIGERMASWTAWSAPAGFEYRYPLTDRRLLEFILGLPPEIRFGNGIGRDLVRGAFAQTLPKGLRKLDVANEKRRHDNRLDWWRKLAIDVENGRLDADCPWLDMPALRAEIRQKPPAEKDAAVKIFTRIFVAMRVYEMHRRQCAPEMADA